MGISTYFEDMGTVLSSFFFKSSGLVLVEVVLSANIHYPGTTEDTWDRRGHSFVYIMKENIFQSGLPPSKVVNEKSLKKPA